MEAMREKLREPFPPEAYQAHGSKSFLTVLKAMYVIERLNDVFGLGKWNLEHKVIKEDNGYVLIRGQLKLSNYPDMVIPAQYGGHKTSGTGTEMADGYKSAITDCITKSASYLEIGIEVFKGLIHPPISDKIGKREKKKDTRKWMNPSDDSFKQAILYLADEDDDHTIEKIEKEYKMAEPTRQQLIDASLDVIQMNTE